MEKMMQSFKFCKIMWHKFSIFKRYLNFQFARIIHIVHNS